MTAPGYPLTLQLIVEPYLNGVRVDTFLTKHLRNYTPWRLQRMVRAGSVRIDQAVAEWTDRVFRGQEVRIALWEPPDHLLPPEPMPLDVLYEDPWLIVVNKPAGVVVHPCGMYATGSLANHLQAHFDLHTPLKGLVRPGVVHRLDRLTSGVMCCSKEHAAHRALSMGFERGQISKTYVALVHGRVRDDRGDIRLAIGQTPGGETIRMSTAPDAVDARPSRTIYEVLERFERCTFVRCRPLTGRLHQIRVHLAAIGHPLLADEFYSGAAKLRSCDLLPPGSTSRGVTAPDTLPQCGSRHNDEILLDRQALHAQTLTFLHPVRKVVVTHDAPLAADMARLLSILRNRPW